MREWKDKHWDAKYEQFRLEKEQRKQNEADRLAGRPITHEPGRVNVFSDRKKVEAQKKIERTFVNKGPSRFLRSHSQSSQQADMPMTGNITIIHDDKPKEEVVMPTVEDGKKEGFDFTKLLPYLFIILAIVIAYLALSGKF